MASGKKNYFRHSFNAFEDEKIQNAIDKLGYAGYAYYFILIELLCKQCETETKNPIRIHQQTLRSVWRKQTKSCKKVVTKLQESGLFVATFNESFVEFDIPNLAKYLGRYTDKNEPNSPKKRKEKKRKENIIKTPKFDIEKIAKNWFRPGGNVRGTKQLIKEIKTVEKYNLLIKAAENYKQIELEKDENFEFAFGFNKFAECWEQWANIKTFKAEQDELIKKLEKDDEEALANERL